MTTAHRPTFDPAKGGTGRNEGDLAKLSQQYSSRDMPSHMTLKYRQKGQAHPDEINTKVCLYLKMLITFIILGSSPWC